MKKIVVAIVVFVMLVGSFIGGAYVGGRYWVGKTIDEMTSSWKDMYVGEERDYSMTEPDGNEVEFVLTRTK